MKPSLIYDLSALVSEDLLGSLDDIAEALDRPVAEIEPALVASAPAYARGEIAQGDYWADIALKLVLEDIDVPATYALRSAEVDSLLMGFIRAQSPLMTLGLVSDSTPDWVGHWRQQLRLDELFHAGIIDSDLSAQQDYPSLLRLAAERVQRKPAETFLVSKKPAHLEHGRSLGMRLIDLHATTDYRTAFAVVTG